MRVIVNQISTLAQIDPESVALFEIERLAEVGSTAGRGGLWRLGDGADEFEVLLPRDRSAVDFPLRMSELSAPLKLAKIGFKQKFSMTLA